MDQMRIGRRGLLKRVCAGAVVAALPGAEALAFGPVQRVGGARLKIGLNAYSFLEMLTENLKDASKGIDLFGVCEFAAKQEIDAVDLTGYFFPGHPEAPADEYINRIKRRAHDLGLDISGTGIANDFATADKSVRETGVALAKRWIEVAARLGAPVIRLFAGPRPPHKDWQTASGNAKREDVEGWMADALRECAEHGKKFGVIVGVQNHADFVMTGADHLSLLKRVDHDWCGALVDTGKYVSDDPYADIAQVAPYAVNWQVKETTGSSLDTPRTDFKRLVKIIRASGYRGYLPIETLAMKRKGYDPAVEVAKVVAELREALGAGD